MTDTEKHQDFKSSELWIEAFSNKPPETSIPIQT
jgi:hypothetical protein